MNRPDLAVPQDATSAFEHAVSLWRSGDYSEAISAVSDLCKKHPGNLYLRLRRIVWLGDYSQGIAGAASTRLRRATIRRLKFYLPLIPARSEIKRILWNEINFQTRSFKRQYLMGLDEVRAGDSGGHFSMGVGAWAHGTWLQRRGQPHKAHLWAQRAVQAWERYIELHPTRLRAGHHGFHAMSLVLLGRIEDAKTAYSRARDLATGSSRENEYGTFEAMKHDFYRCIGLVPSGSTPAS